MDDFEAAAEEWDNVIEIVPTFAKGCPNSNEENGQEQEILRETPLVTVAEFIQDFRATINLEEESEFDQEPDRNPLIGQTSSLISWIKCSCFQPRINLNLEDEKKLIYAISKKPLADENPLHFDVLLSLYKLLTGSKLDCPRYGSHWEQIGFQGNDPATDLRGVGCLGLIQPLYLVMTPELFPLSKDMYLISLSENQNFPFLVLSINVTRMSLHALRDGLLNRQIIQENSVWSALNFFYVAVMYHIYKIWKTEYKTIKDSGYVLKDSEKYCRKNVKIAINNLNNHLVTAYSVHEKQAARENIQRRTRNNED